MDDGQIKLAQAACRVASEVPMSTLQLVCQRITAALTLAAARHTLGQLTHAHYRAVVMEYLDACMRVVPTPAPATVGLALLTAACSAKSHRDEQAVELVWTGPDTDAVPFRRTEQAILQVLDSAMQRITLVSYAVYKVPNICESLIRAARRGVKLTVVLETPDLLEGQNEYNTLQALGPEVAACSGVYYWPERKRQHHGDKPGILHVKCAVADGRWMFLSSANLTEYAFTINMELGVLITGGELPRWAERQFDELKNLYMLVPLGS